MTLDSENCMFLRYDSWRFYQCILGVGARNGQGPKQRGGETTASYVYLGLFLEAHTKVSL